MDLQTGLGLSFVTSILIFAFLQIQNKNTTDAENLLPSHMINMIALLVFVTMGGVLFANESLSFSNSSDSQLLSKFD